MMDTYDLSKRPNAKERSLKVGADIESEQSLVFVVQAVLSVNPNIPAWATMYWWAYGPALDKFKKHPDRIGHGDDSPKFRTLNSALSAWEACKKQKTHRVRVIIRYTAIHETLVQ